MDEIIKKKRGRKQKIQQTTIIQPEPHIIKKRGRKPKNTILNTTTNNIDVNKTTEIDFEDNITINSKINPINNIWVKKYQPIHSNEIIGNKEHITIIKKWLLNFEISKEHALVISGGHGIGKNLITTLLLNELGYEIKTICSTTLKNKDIINETIQSCNKKNIYITFGKSINKKYAIIIDDTESITLTSEKDNLLELFKLNEKHKYFPIIFISNLQHSKLTNNLKKIALDIILDYPPINDIKKYIQIICKNESMNIHNDDVYIQIIKFCQLDIRKLLYVLQDLYYTYNNTIITTEIFREYQQITQKKDMDIGLYYAAKSLLDNYKSINKCFQLYETEKVLLPLTIYENYYKKLFKQALPNKTILTIMANVADSISNGDVIETNIYSDQNWFLQNIHGFFTCVNTSYIINNTKENNTKENNTKERNTFKEKNTTKINYDLVFSADLNKTSSKNINKKKNIANIQNKFKYKNIDDVLYLNKIFYELEKNKNNQIIKILKNSYNLDNKNIQIALKIDKTNLQNKNDTN